MVIKDRKTNVYSNSRNTISIWRTLPQALLLEVLTSLEMHKIKRTLKD